MPERRIFNSKGELLNAPNSSINESVVDRMRDIVRLLVDPEEKTVELYFRVKESDVSRAEQRYAVVEFEDWDSPIKTALYALQSWEKQHDNEIVTTHDSMAVFKCLSDFSRVEVPGTSDHRSICADMASDISTAGVCVGSAEDAVGLLSHIGGGSESVAITSGVGGGPVDDIDFTIKIGDVSHPIQPMQDSLTLWNSLTKNYNSVSSIDAESLSGEDVDAEDDDNSGGSISSLLGR